VGLPEQTTRNIEMQWDSHDSVREWLAQHGIHPMAEPQVVCPEVTPDMLLNPDPRSYAELFSNLVQWQNYFDELLAEACACLLPIENEMEDIESAKRTHFRKMNEGKPRNERTTDDEIKDLILQDPRHRELRLAQQTFKQHKLFIETKVEQQGRKVRMVSRQVTIRQNELEAGQRAGNVSTSFKSAKGTWERGFAPRT
jgi:hypothetical protein